MMQVGLTEVPMNTPDGAKSVAAYKAVIWAVFKNAMDGKVMSARLFIELQREAMREWLKDNPSLQQLDRNEALLLRQDLDDWERMMIDKARQRSVKGLN